MEMRIVLWEEDPPAGDGIGQVYDLSYLAGETILSASARTMATWNGGSTLTVRTVRGDGSLMTVGRWIEDKIRTEQDARRVAAEVWGWMEE
jgi:hypothetical protein